MRHLFHLTTPEADLGRGEVTAVGGSADEAIGIATDAGVEPESPVLDRYGRVIAILRSGGSEDKGPRPAVSLDAIQAVLEAQDVQPVIVYATEMPFTDSRSADSTRLLTKMVYCDAPAAIPSGRE